MRKNKKPFVKHLFITYMVILLGALALPNFALADETDSPDIPSVTWGDPYDNMIVVGDYVTVRGSAKNVDKLTINGSSVSISNNGTFSRSVTLRSIVNEITVKAYQGSEEVFSETKTVYYSFTPTIEVMNYEPGGATKSSEVVLEGDITPYNAEDIQTFTINGAPASVRNGEFTSSPVFLKEGVNEIKMVVKTKSYSIPDGRTIPAREITKTFRIEYEAGAQIEIYDPEDEEIIYSNQVKVSGRVIDSAGIKTIKIGDKEADVDSDGRFAETITLKNGKNEIKLTFKEGSKTVTETLTVYSNILASDGSEMVFDVKDGQEIKAFNDALKIKLAKNSVGSNTKAVVEVDNAYLATLPSQTAIISPTFHIDWDGDKPLKPYKVTIKYDETIKDNQAQKITVLFYDDRSAGWKAIGGIVDSKNYSVSVDIQNEGYVAAALSYVTFGDITNHWAKRDIEFLAAKGAIAGRGTGYSFQPDSSITRAEFVTCLAKTIGLLPYNPLEISYYDVPSTHWAFGYIEAASRAGLISGTSYGAFAPNRTITREEAAAILTRAGNLKAAAPQELNSIIGTFKDNAKISPWAKAEVAAAVKAKIINGNEKMQFMPTATTTRAQAVTMITRLYEYITKTK